MKYFGLVCRGMADEPMEALSGRTPLEVAKTPAMDALAKIARLGKSCFVPHTLTSTPEVAMFSLLGFDPVQDFTGLAPLEALALNIPQADQQVAFRSDFVTVAEDALIDPSAGHISQREALILLEELKRHSDGTFLFHAIDGYRNLVLISAGNELLAYDELECAQPSKIVSQKITKFWPKGKLQAKMMEWMQSSRVALENHDVNRVRIDLGENPANMVWFWGQGKKPKLPPFKERYGKSGSVVAKTLFMKGLAKALAMDTAADAVSAKTDVRIVYRDHETEEKKGVTLKSKIRRIEIFDEAVVAPVLREYLAHKEDTRILVASDYAECLQKKDSGHGQVPVMMIGPGFEISPADVFDEKHALASGVSFEPGHGLMKIFLN